MHIGCYVPRISCKSIQVVRYWELSFLSVARTAKKYEKRDWFGKYLETNNIKKNAQCVHTIALVCSPKIGIDMQPWTPLNKLTKLFYPVKVWERSNTIRSRI